jgi:K+-transporting ATPase ATPase C chain
MFAILRPAIVLLVMFTVLTGLAYPMLVTGVTQVILPTAANGSLIRKEGRVVGSRLIGQSFATDAYFHGRPSATSAPDPKDDTKTVDAPYNAASSVGSNLGPLSKKLIDRVDADVATLQKSSVAAIPADAVTASASGLDPHISPAFAAIQIERVARVRGVTADRIQTILDRAIERPFLNLFGEPRVNVLMLNLAVDAALRGANG